MSEPSYLPSSLIGSKVTFSRGRAETGTWLLTEKLSETYTLYNERDYRVLGGVSTAHGSFACRNVNDSNQTAIMRVFMQIPHSGSLAYKQSERAAQAFEKFDYYTRIESKAYHTLTDAGCKCIRPFLGYKVQKQNEDDPVPGGFLVFLLLGHVPGIQLDSVFWELPFSEREQIRQAFRAAWEELVQNGIHCSEWSLSSLSWDRDENKIYITQLQQCETTTGGYWKDVFWFPWDLAVPPTGYRYSEEKQAHPDHSNWKM